MADHPDFPDHEMPPQEAVSIPDVLPVMALRDAVLFPYAIIPLTVGRDMSVQAVEEALAGNRLVLVLTQQDPQEEKPQPEELYQIGCVALIMRMLKLPDGTIRILIQGLSRAKVDYFTRSEPSLEARLSTIEEPDPGQDELEWGKQIFFHYI